MKTKKTYQSGAVLILYVTLATVILIFFLILTQSRFLLSTKRSAASSDALLTSYQAESEVNNFLAKVIGGYVSSSDLVRGIRFDKNVSGTNIHIEASSVISGNNETQTITATAKRASAVSKIEGIREINTIEESTKDVEIAIILDCTSSMDTLADPLDPAKGTRFRQERIALAENFLQKIIELPNSYKYHLGIGLFGSNAKWLDTSWISGSKGTILKPDSGLSALDLKSIVETGITDIRNDGICKNVNDGTSVGSGYALANEYFATDTLGYKKVILLITDGEPNARQADSNCPPSWSCLRCLDDAKEFMRCHLAKSDTYISENGYNGRRQNDVDAYSVTVYSDVSAEVIEIFTKYGVANGYFGLENATQLPEKLLEILDIIIKSNSTFSIRRAIP